MRHPSTPSHDQDLLQITHSLARAQIYEVDHALTNWPRCNTCQKYIPTNRINSAHRTKRPAYHCSARCAKVAWRRRWTARQRAIAREERALRRALAPALATEAAPAAPRRYHPQSGSWR